MHRPEGHSGWCVPDDYEETPPHAIFTLKTERDAMESEHT